MSYTTYQLKQQMDARRDTFMIYDEAEVQKYFITKKILSWGHTYVFQDMNKKDLLLIERKEFKLQTTFTINKEGQEWAVLTKQLSWSKPKLFLDLPGDNDYFITGNLEKKEFVFQKHGEDVAWVSKSFFSFGDVYGVKIAHTENAELILATAVVIDLIFYDGK